MDEKTRQALNAPSKITVYNAVAGAPQAKPAPPKQQTPAVAFIKCLDCGRNFSTQESACPHCGCPIEGHVNEPAAQTSHGETINPEAAGLRALEATGGGSVSPGVQTVDELRFKRWHAIAFKLCATGESLGSFFLFCGIVILILAALAFLIGASHGDLYSVLVGVGLFASGFLNIGIGKFIIASGDCVAAILEVNALNLRLQNESSGKR